MCLRGPSRTHLREPTEGRSLGLPKMAERLPILKTNPRQQKNHPSMWWLELSGFQVALSHVQRTKYSRTHEQSSTARQSLLSGVGTSFSISLHWLVWASEREPNRAGLQSSRGGLQLLQTQHVWRMKVTVTWLTGHGLVLHSSSLVGRPR